MTPALDYDQPDRLEIEGSIKVERPREALEEKLEGIAERLAETAPPEKPDGTGSRQR